MRLRLIVTAMLGASLFTAAPAALGSKTESRGVGPEYYAGQDWVGRTKLTYDVSSGPNETGPPDIFGLMFANECNRRGSTLERSITIHRDGHFAYSGHGFRIVGHVIGSHSAPREIAGTASVRTQGCVSGPWWFDAFPQGG
jgi:hypothetical protein